MGQWTLCVVVLVGLAHCAAPSFLSRTIKHELRGRSLGRQLGKEVYEYEGHLYSFHLDPLPWDEAFESCQAEGGYLAVLEDIQEVDFVSHAMDGNLCSFAAFQNVWIGGRWDEAVERWLWAPTGYEVSGKVGDEDYPPWKINRRPGYDCLNLDQDLTHKPKFTDLECFRPRRYLCEEGCALLRDTPRGHWEPEDCSMVAQHPGEECRLVCHPGFEPDGDTDMRCSDEGWDSGLGLNRLPGCHNGNDIGQDLIDTINNTVAGKDVEFLFILDESAGVSDTLFQYQKDFAQIIVRAFPLSATRSAGLLTYSEATVTHLSVNTDSTCRFLRTASNLGQGGGEGNNREEALTAAKEDIEANRAHNLTLVFLLSGSTNQSVVAAAVADSIKATGDVIISLALANSDRDEMQGLASGIDFLFTAKDPEVFAMANRYIQKVLGNNTDEDCSYFACDGLDDSDRGHWEPPSCNEATLENGTCQLVCKPEYSVHGPSLITCTPDGWVGPVGVLNELPKCYTPEETGDDFGDEINRTLSDYYDSSFLFIMDESGSVGEQNFEIERAFVKSIVSAFPLSPTRRAGAITFATDAAVDIPLTVDSTCTFIKMMDKIKYTVGNTNIAAALETGNREAAINNRDNKTIIFLITDGKSQTDPRPPATVTKDRGNLLFTVGVAEFDETQLIPISTVSNHTGAPHFFGVQSFELFQELADYLNTTYNTDNREDCSVVCKKLSDSDRGHWEAPACSQQDGTPGQECRLVCDEQYELRGSDPLVCGPDGWTGTGGDFQIPQCYTPEELGGDFVDKINDTISNGIPTNLIFVLDESGSVTQPNFDLVIDFVSAVVQAFPLSSNRTAGCVTFSDTAVVDIPLTTTDTCEFISGLKSIRYSGGGTNILTALQAASAEIDRNGRHPQTLLFLITDGKSSSNPQPAADALKAKGVIVFSLAVADYDQAQLEPLCSVGPDGTSNFFGVHDFKTFQIIGDYLNSTHGSGVECTRERLSLYQLPTADSEEVF